MDRKEVPCFLLILWLFFPVLWGLNFPLRAQNQEQGSEKAQDIEALKKVAPRIYIDCAICDIDYIRTEITFVNYVRDRKEAQIHILITTQRTGSGGKEFTLTFMGQNEFEGINDVHKYFSSQTDTEDEIREGLVRALKIGLMSYMARTPLRRHLAISYTPEAKPQEVKDKWNYWVFSLSGRGFFSGESSYHYESISTNLSANRVTPEIKIRLSFYLSSYKSTFKYDSLKIVSQSDSASFNGLLVKSLGEHWSVGAFLNINTSTYENIKVSFSPAPAIEYNFFPYSFSSRRQLRCLYRLSFNTVRYREETIYDKLRENLWSQSLSLTLDLREKWGTISTTLSGSHYFHDFRRNRLNLFTVVNLSLFKGLSFSTLAGASRIHDQLSLAKKGASLEEVLLRRRQLETSYSYFLSIGLSYTFGSVFTNVVNPRFGSEGVGGVTIRIE